MNENERFKTRFINALKNIKTALTTKNEEGEPRIVFAFNVLFQVAKSLVYLLIVLLLLGGSLGLGIGAGYFAFLVSDTDIPTKNELQQKINDVELISNFTYANGEKIADIRSDLIRTNVNSGDMAQDVKKALIATEDEYFDEHKGIVPKAVLRALVSDAYGTGSSSGGSTITQQLVKQQVLTSETTFKRKANELVLALRVEKFFSKDEIITAYLNVSPFGRNNKGQNIAGVEEAAKGIFGRHAKELSLPQSAFIAGLPQSPIVYSPYTNTGEIKKDTSLGLRRKDQVLYNMYKEEVITKKQYDEAKSYDLQKDFRPTEGLEGTQNGFLYYTIHEQAVQALMPSFYKEDNVSEEEINKKEALYNKYHKVADRELRRNGYTVNTTIDKNIYNAMQNTGQEQGNLELGMVQGKTVEAGSVLMENNTGKILGFFGGRNYNDNQFNHAFQAKRSPGSTMKPLLVYAPAIDIGLVGSESKLANFPRTYRNGQKFWNYGGKAGNNFESVKQALKVSDNIPVVNLYDRLLEVAEPKTYFEKMNIFLKEEEYFNQSLPLGTTELTVFEQTNAFSTLANRGQYAQGHTIEKITDHNGNVVYEHKYKPVDVFSPATASIMNDMMKEVLKPSDGTGLPAKQHLDAINPTLSGADWSGKTGTSEEDKDFWFTASTPSVTLSAWIGIDESKSMPSNYRENNLRFWAELANAAYQQKPELFGVDQRFSLDSTVIKSKVSDFTGQKLGMATINNTQRQVPGKEIISLFAKKGAPTSQFNFGIGGTDAQFQAAWGKAPLPPVAPPKKKEEKKKDNKKEQMDEQEQERERDREQGMEQEYEEIIETITIVEGN